MAEIETAHETADEIRSCNQSVVRLVKADITMLDVEAFLFYARPDLSLGSGFGSAITRRGGPAIKKELDQLGTIRTTEAVLTSGGNLKARYIVHAAGPMFQEENLTEKLRATLLNALRCAEDKGIRQIALPAMGAGFYGVPLSQCAEVMIRTITEYLANHSGIREVVLCANDGREYKPFAAGIAKLPRG